MPSKEAIIDNIEQYTAQELIKYIRDGIVTLPELISETEGYFPAHVRREVEQMLKGSESDDWKKAQETNTEESYLNFIQTYPESVHASEARNAIFALKAAAEQSVKDGLWNSVDKNDIQSLREFIKSNPSDPHVTEARRMINTLQEEEIFGFDIDALINKIKAIQTDKTVLDPDALIFREIVNCIDRQKITHEDLLSVIRRDNNLLRASVVKKLIEEGYLEYMELIQPEVGIDRRFVQHLAKGAPTQQFTKPAKLEKINKQSTEVYFWGIPSSGKSCALGAILSVANNGSIARSMAKDANCQGYGYMTRLAQLFKADGKVGTLPPGTPTTSTFEMAFDLEDEKGVIHPITCIDLAGELVRCMYKYDANEIMTEEEMEALDTLTNVLIDNRTVNRKMHFFVLEYGGEDRTYEGLSQTEYLDAALRYIERTKIFEKETDAIYLMLTKVDKTGVVGEELVKVLTEYIEKNYLGFFNGLEQICRKCEINGGKVERIPFSLGRVCFQDYCLFTEAPAANVVRKILTRSWGYKNGKLQKGLNFFKG
ncbi:MAG: hypothetical protein K2K82_06420 [Muribaculaceae bacterium]|nr:hypothetical protein [Muribaculaceae bacterium]